MHKALSVAFKSGSAARMPWITPKTLTSIMARMVASDISSSRPPGAIPALLNKISIRPPLQAENAATAFEKASASVTSKVPVITASDPISALAAASAAASRSNKPTRQPACANRCPVASPIPPAPPVIKIAFVSIMLCPVVAGSVVAAFGITVSIIVGSTRVASQAQNECH